jgi:hypothetical protein
LKTETFPSRTEVFLGELHMSTSGLMKFYCRVRVLDVGLPGSCLGVRAFYTSVSASAIGICIFGYRVQPVDGWPVDIVQQAWDDFG